MLLKITEKFGLATVNSTPPMGAGPVSDTVAVTLFPPFTVAGESVSELSVVEVMLVDDELELEEPHAVRKASDNSRRALDEELLTRAIHPSGFQLFK